MTAATKPGVLAVLTPGEGKVIEGRTWQFKRSVPTFPAELRGQVRVESLYFAEVYTKDSRSRAVIVDAEALDEARATVERLVKADEAYDHAKARRIEADNRITSGDRSDEAFRRQASAGHAYDRAVDERRAALAAFRGEAP